MKFDAFGIHDSTVKPMPERSKTIPKYYRISRDTIERIQQGDLTPGAKIPSENEIIEAYSVSNTTARKALQELEQSGWVTRIKGKGTFVRNRTIERSATRILGFTKNMIEAGRTPSTKLVGLHLFEPSRSISINNRQYTLEGPLCKIQRLRLGDDVPIMFETRYISTRFCPGLHKHDLERSLYEIYEKEYALQLYEIQQELSAVMLARDVLTYFDLDESVPAFRVDGVTFGGKELILEMEQSFYRGDIYQFTVTAKR